MLFNNMCGTVGPHCEGCAEVGFYPLHPTPAGRRLTEWPPVVYQWHREGFDLPRGTKLLAKGGLYASLWARQREADEARERLAQALEEDALPDSRAAERLEDEALAST